MQLWSDRPSKQGRVTAHSNAGDIMPSYYQTTFQSFSLGTLPSNASSRNPWIVDLNGDGKLDLINVYFVMPTVNQTVDWRAFLGDGKGGFTEATSTVFPGGAPWTVWPTSSVLADLNGDGRIDFVSSDWGMDTQPFPGSVNAMALSKADGTYVNASSGLPQYIGNTHHIAAADIDGDRDVDLLIVDSRQGASAYFLINDGTGKFTQDFTRADIPKNPNGNFYYTNSLFFDYNGDGKQDLLLTTPSIDVLSTRLFLNDGTGHFTSAIASIPRPTGVAATSNSFIESLVSTDLNGDGRLDIIVGWQVDFYSSGRLQALINDGAGGFIDRTDSILFGTTLAKEPDDLLLIDINGDGHLDLVTSFGDTAPIWLNDGAGRFVRLQSTINEGPYYSTPADINGDGIIDFVEGTYVYEGKEWIRAHLGLPIPTSQTGTASAEGFMAGRGATTVLSGAGDDTIIGGGGQDFLRGEDGNDVIYGGDSFDDTHGNAGDDTVYGGAGDDWVVGGKDQDLLYGDSGADVCLGNLGNDTIYGGAGNDVVRGGQGDDIVYGEDGADFVSGDRGNDTLYGGAGADSFHTFSGAGIDRVMDFSIAQGDRVQLLPGATYTATQVGADVVVETGEGAQLILIGVQLSALPAGWIFGF